MKKTAVRLFIFIFLVGISIQFAMIDPAIGKSSECKKSLCTIEIWLAHKWKKQNREIRDFLKSNSIKVLRHTIQYFKPRGGHPPTNIAIGSGINAEDARFVIDLAIKYNDNVDRLIIQSLNPPHYAAIATSAWDDKSEVRISPEDLKALREPKLSTEEFHTLYRKLTDEANITRGFY